MIENKTLEVLKEKFSVCKVSNFSTINIESSYYFTAKTDKEYSLVCPTKDIPDNTLIKEDNWRAIRIKGTLEFSLVGILSRILNILAKKEISTFVISTYNTDYILIKEDKLEEALYSLKENAYDIRFL